MKDPFDRTKVVLRHLPPALPQAVLVEQIDARFADRYNWFCFRPGKSCQKRPRYSRAYFNFKNPEDVVEFAELFDGHVFVNEKGSQFKTIVEYAPSQRVPKLSSKKDGREGTIFKDPEYVGFLEQLAKPVENLPSAEVQLERKEAERAGQPKESIITTPLMDFVRQKRATKNAPQRSSANGRLGRRTSTASPNSNSAKRSSDKRKSSTSVYVLRDTTRNASNKEKSAYLLVSKREDQQLSDNPMSSAEADTAQDESAVVSDVTVSGVELGKGKLLLLKGKQKEIVHVSGDTSQQHSIATSKPSQRREASGRIIRSILSNKESQTSTGPAFSEQQMQSSNLEKDKRPPRPTNIRSMLKEHISSISLTDSDMKRTLHDKAANSDLHSSTPVNERHDRRTRNRDRPDRVVWTPLRRPDGSNTSGDHHPHSSQSGQLVAASFDGISKAGDDAEDGTGNNSLASGKPRSLDARGHISQLGRGTTRGQDLGETRGDASGTSRIGEIKNIGSGRSSQSSVENGSHRQGGRRGLAHGLKEADGAVNLSEGKHSQRRGNASYVSHEKQVWVQKSNSGI